MEPGNRIRIVRENLGLTQAAFGEKLGLSQTNVKDIEIGRKKVSVEIALEIERIYHADFRWLFTGAEGRGGATGSAPDPIVAETIKVMAGMDQETQREVMKYAQDKRQLGDLKKLVLSQDSGWIALSLLNVLALPGMLVLAAVGFKLLSGPDALDILRKMPTYWVVVLDSVIKNPIPWGELLRARCFSCNPIWQRT